MASIRVYLAVLVTSALATSCGGGGGGGSSSAPDPEISGAKTSMVARSTFASSEACPDGGITIDQGIDTNENGVLDPEEVFEAQQVCNGAAGAPGIASLVRVDEVAAGVQCTYGGLKVSVGLDASDDGVLDPVEVTQTSYVCSLVASQTDGFSTLMDLGDEAAGANCIAGGQKVSTGLDTDRDAFLDPEEIIQIKYVCNGESPLVYQVLARTQLEVAGGNCEFGGLALQTGLDTNQNQALDTSEVDATSYICNGADATGVTSLIDIQNEPIGANCTSGGKKILTGLDEDDNGALGQSEIGNVAYICNGQDGADGVGASTEPTEFISVFERYNQTVSLDCTADDAVGYRSVTSYYTLAEGADGTPYKACTMETCRVNIQNGSSSETLNTGGCYDNDYTSITCNTGYAWNGTACVAPPAVCGVSRPDLCVTQQTCEDSHGFWYENQCNAACPEGQVESSRGCEVPVASCSVYEQVVDNQCQAISYVDLTGNICGNYEDPIRVMPGQHFVTCNTDFRNRLFIEPGAVLQVDREWDLIAENGVKINGASGAPVVIETSPNNPNLGWNSLKLKGKVALDYATGNFLGDFARYLQVSGYAERFELRGLGIENTSITGDAGAYIYDALVRNSSINPQSTIWSYGALLDNANLASSDRLYTYGGLVMRSDLPTVSAYDGYGSYTDQLGLQAAALLFNPNVAVNCSAQWGAVQGNASASGSVGSCLVSDNGSPMSTKYAAYVLGSGARETMLGVTESFEAYIVDLNGFVQPTEVVWKARYDVDGTYYDSGQTWLGRKVDIVLPQKEAWDVYVHSVNGKTDLLGPRTVTVDVQ